MVQKSKETQKALIQYKGEMVTITFQDVKDLICPLATDQEAAVFLKTAQSLQLNPFASEIYLIKYSDRDKAATVIAIDAYLKAGEANENYDGHEAGIILKDSAGKLEFREGSFLLEEEQDKLAGGWAKVFRRDRKHSFYMAVNKAECVRYTRDGHLTKFWTKEKQPMMLRKTALKRAMAEAFPQLFADSYATAEFEPLSENELPKAYDKEGAPHWPKFYARQKEKGLSPDEVHSLLGVESLKADWLDKGKTLEEAENIINDALEKVALESTQLTTIPETEKLGKQDSKPEQEPETFNDLYKICFALYKLQPADVLRELGVSSLMDLTITPVAALQTINALYKDKGETDLFEDDQDAEQIP